MVQKKFIRGAHSLSAMFEIKNFAKLLRAMQVTVSNGGTIFEIPYLLCKLSWAEVAQAAHMAGITEISLCLFYPANPDGTAACGDPLGNAAEVEAALAMIQSMVEAAKELRGFGLTVRFIDGPSWGMLGKTYDLSAEEQEKRVVSFLKKAGAICYQAGLILAVEPLRPGEGNVIKGTPHMVKILELVDMPKAVGLHFDVYHSIKHGEDPAEMMVFASKWIVYIHAHGDDRIAPGAEGDKQDWNKIVAASLTNDNYAGVNVIPWLPEPFGPETVAENAALGDGLPPALPLAEYLPIAYSTFEEAGLPLAA